MKAAAVERRGGDVAPDLTAAIGWALAQTVADALDDAHRVRDRSAVARLHVELRRALAAVGLELAGAAPAPAPAPGEGDLPDDDGSDPLDRAYADLCSAELGDSPQP